MAFALLRLRPPTYALTLEQRQAVRDRFRSLKRTAANYAAVARELKVSSSTIQRCVRGGR